jgi:hypothetical protein
MNCDGILMGLDLILVVIAPGRVHVSTGLGEIPGVLLAHLEIGIGRQDLLNMFHVPVAL